jgi:hypothetical protein
VSNSIFLGLAIHSHQPVGNFDFVFSEAYEKAYEPFLALLERHPNIKMTLHYSGALCDWLMANRPEFLPRVAALVARGQVELMTGGYYEPILVAIPEDDRLGQIRKMTRAVREDFGHEARGAWLTERVWEPSLAKLFAQVGVEYTVVDDAHFHYAGFRGEIFGYYVTEEEGWPFKLFASSKRLRYTIPWQEVKETIEWLQEEATPEGTKIAVMGDDGEKFGLWPGTYEHLWKRGWMEEFFTALEENSSWLRTITLGEYAERYPAAGRVYLPDASYEEMTEWALPAALSREIVEIKDRLKREGRKETLSFVRGGFWRHFLVKYPEVNDLHKKMLLAHDKVRAMPPSPWQEKALDELWKGQSNCPYWHGVFGGIYLPHIRAANYQHLLAAETLADEALHPEGGWLECSLVDFRRDTHKELLVSGDSVNLYFDLRRGGAIFEWDWREKGLNLLNNISRRPEGYHRRLEEIARRETQESEEPPKTIHEIVGAKEEGLEAFLVYDAYRRTAFIDHFLPLELHLPDFWRGDYEEIGDFVDQPYKHEIREEPGRLHLTLFRDGYLLPFRVEKRFSIPSGEVELPVTYQVTNNSPQTIAVRFGIELNFGLLSGHSPHAYYEIEGHNPYLDSTGETEGVAAFGLVNRDLGLAIRLKVDPEATLWRFPIETVSQSESGFERIYQASSLLLHWRLRLEPGQGWPARLLVRFDKIEA